MLHVLVIVRSFLLLITYAQYRSLWSGTVVFDFFASFLDFKYSRGGGGGGFFRLKPLIIIFLRKPCQMVSSFLSSLADNSQDCALYSSLLRTQASKRLIRLGIFILLSVRKCFSSFHFWKADEMRNVR